MTRSATPAIGAGAPAPAPHLLDKRRQNVIFGTVLFGMLLAALDSTIVSTALPTIVSDLGGAGHLSWVVTAYLLAETISSVLAGKFGDLFGRKLVFQLSAALFVLGSFFCGLAHNLPTLVMMRGLQGIGGGGLMVTATALIADVIPLRERGKYQGALGAVFGVTTVVAQVHLRGQGHRPVGIREIARAHLIPASVLDPAFAAAVTQGYLRPDGDLLALTSRGDAEFAKLTGAWKAWLYDRLPVAADGGPGRDALDAALRRLAVQVAEQQQLAPAV